MTNIFVYGSLKPGFKAYNMIKSMVVKEPVAARIINAELYNLGQFPTVVIDPKIYGTVYGFVLTGEDSFLSYCDFLEGYPDLFVRKEVEATLMTGGTTRAWVYTIADTGGLSQTKKIQGGHWNKSHEGDEE